MSPSRLLISHFPYDRVGGIKEVVIVQNHRTSRPPFGPSETIGLLFEISAPARNDHEVDARLVELREFSRELHVRSLVSAENLSEHVEVRLQPTIPISDLTLAISKRNARVTVPDCYTFRGCLKLNEYKLIATGTSANNEKVRLVRGAKRELRKQICFVMTEVEIFFKNSADDEVRLILADHSEYPAFSEAGGGK